MQESPWLLHCSSNDFGVLVVFGSILALAQDIAYVGPTSLQCGEKTRASIVQ